MSTLRRDRFVFAGVVLGAMLVTALLMSQRLRQSFRQPESEQWEEPPPEPPPPTAPMPTDAGPPPPKPPPPYVHLDPLGKDECLPGMVLVDGIQCPFVAHRCEQFLSEPDDVCKTFVAEALCEGRLTRRRFCIDVFEYPNLEGVRPAVRVDFREAERACSLEGKRLCTVDEWIFACEGTQMWPFPYGLERDAEACNIDRPEPTPSRPEVARDPRRAAEENERLDQRVASGDKERCISPFGVRDLTGNVAEWAVNPNGKIDETPFRSAAVGGGFTMSPSRCRAMTTHPPTFSSHEMGFRCCKAAIKKIVGGGQPLDTPAGPRKRKLVPP
jgi:hypothetical protein